MDGVFYFFLEFIKNAYNTIVFLDTFYPFNIFDFLSSLNFWIDFSKELCVVLDFFVLCIYDFLVIAVFLIIFIILLWNMFSFSLHTYVLYWCFDFQQLPLYQIEFPEAFKAELILKLLTDLKYHWWAVLPYIIADGLIVILIFLFNVIVFNALLYYNFLSFIQPVFSLTIDFNLNFIRWIPLNFGSIYFGFVFDSLSILMLVVVLTISTLVHYYSIDYMASDPWLLTFLKYLSGFTLAMVILVTANNFALLFMGWEGVGLFSYLLIGFWYTRVLALKASLKAVIVNWIGDVALIIASGMSLNYFGTLEFDKLFNAVSYLFVSKLDFATIDFKFFTASVVTVICIFLIIAAVGKSAQFGLHTWLPDAMEGPTPVSALIHAATMVTAGVYLVVRTSFFFEYSEVGRNLILILGAFTAMFGSIVASYQFDIKWIIAFSTCSQLGYMFLACGLSAYNLAMFHLFIHAFFKALLFLCAGSVIHAIGDEQDIWKMGGLLYYLPITYVGLCIGFFSLAGLPFTSGFFSKDTIIELALAKRTIPALYGYICGSVGAWFTAFYSFRFFYFVIFWFSRLPRLILLNAHEHGKNMLMVIAILSFITVFVGGITKNPLTSSFSFVLFSDSIFVSSYNFYFSLFENFIDFYEEVHGYIFNYIKWILFILPFFGAYFSLFYWWYLTPYTTYDALCDAAEQLEDTSRYTKSEFGKEVHNDEALNKLFEFKGTADEIYNKFFVLPVLIFSYHISYKELDRGWLEFFLLKFPVFFSFFFSKPLGQNFKSLKLNLLLALFFLAGVLLVLFLLLVNF